MADGIEITPGSGAEVSTKELDVIDGVTCDPQHVQRVSIVSINETEVGRDVRFDPYPFQRTEALLSALIGLVKAQNLMLASAFGFKDDPEDLAADAARGTT